MILFKKFIILLTLLLIINCQTIDKKISETTDKENKLLSEFLGKKSEALKEKFGEPDVINLEVPYKIYVYYKKNLLIKCTREFFINPKTDLLEKFTSKNCIK